MLKRFKDLFRGSIEIEHLLAAEGDWRNSVIERTIPTAGSKFKVFYIILDLSIEGSSMAFELQVVKSLQKHSASHGWYELKRNESWENLLSFIKREICVVGP